MPSKKTFQSSNYDNKMDIEVRNVSNTSFKPNRRKEPVIRLEAPNSNTPTKYYVRWLGEEGDLKESLSFDTKADAEIYFDVIKQTVASGCVWIGTNKRNFI